jgi:hypothetical protein
MWQNRKTKKIKFSLEENQFFSISASENRKIVPDAHFVEKKNCCERRKTKIDGHKGQNKAG